MAYFFWIGVFLAIVYGLISAASGVFQFKERQIPMWSAILITIVGGTLVISALFLLINPKMIIILTFCLVFMHIAAIANGLTFMEKSISCIISFGLVFQPLLSPRFGSNTRGYIFRQLSVLNGM